MFVVVVEVLDLRVAPSNEKRLIGSEVSSVYWNQIQNNLPLFLAPALLSNNFHSVKWYLIYDSVNGC